MKSKHHNFWFSLNCGKVKPSDEISIYIFYKYGDSGQRKKRIPNIKVPYQYWDKKSKSIKQIAVDKNILSVEETEYTR